MHLCNIDFPIAVKRSSLLIIVVNRFDGKAEVKALFKLLHVRSTLNEAKRSFGFIVAQLHNALKKMSCKV